MKSNRRKQKTCFNTVIAKRIKLETKSFRNNETIHCLDFLAFTQ